MRCAWRPWLTASCGRCWSRCGVVRCGVCLWVAVMVAMVVVVVAALAARVWVWPVWFIAPYTVPALVSDQGRRAAVAGATPCRSITGFNGARGACCDPAHSPIQPRTPHTAQVLLKRVRKAGEALRRSAYTEVDLLAAGSGSPPPADLGAWEGLAAGGWERVWRCGGGIRHSPQ